ncbi:MAG TPA: Uma2 family endonuclease [Isosphaeraceae bacterium]|nr:Uma2 family endonuclease [Isosphaeraceae bacterium]
MSQATLAPPPLTTKQPWRTVADLLECLGDIPADRVLIDPPPGTATEQDVIAVEAQTGRLCELVDGVLVEKPMGYDESRLAVELMLFLGEYLRHNDLGALAGEAGTLRLMPGLVRSPDVSFVVWQRMPPADAPRTPIPDLAPDLAVEVLSESNTPKEMERKLREYFDAGASLVWYIDGRARTVTVYTAPDQFTVLDESATLDGGDLLPGFALPLRELFARASRRGPGA